MEKIRLHIGIDKWTIFAGSYGSTLGLTYAIHYPEKVKRMVEMKSAKKREKNMLFRPKCQLYL